MKEVEITLQMIYSTTVNHVMENKGEKGKSLKLYARPRFRFIIFLLLL